MEERKAYLRDTNQILRTGAAAECQNPIGADEQESFHEMIQDLTERERQTENILKCCYDSDSWKEDN